ncbi:MAG: C25 family cysteine peptidase [Candidatus Acidiferrales bacterium]
MRSIEAVDLADSRLFAALCEAALARGLRVRFRARGQSMQPNLLDGDIAEIEPARQCDLKGDDIAFTRRDRKFLLHRVIGRDATTGDIVTRGDAGLANDLPVDEVLGKVVMIERHGKTSLVGRRRTIFAHSVRRHAHRLRRAVLRRASGFRFLAVPALLVFFGLFLHAPSARAQFTITNSASATTVTPGTEFTYTQVLTYNGFLFTPSGTNPVTTVQSVSADTTVTNVVVTGTASGYWNYVIAGNTLTYTDKSGAGYYFVGDTTTFTVTVEVGADTPSGTVITDKVTANPGNSSASANSTVEVADLAMTQSEMPNPVATGAEITYTETVTNNSATLSAYGATLVQSTPANSTFASVAAPAGWTCGTIPAVGGTGTITCTANGALNPGATANFTIVVTVNAAASVGSTITNSATVSEDGTDPNLSNNTTTTTTVVSGADLAMTQTASPTAVAPGAQITYSETVTNNGPDAAVGAVLYQKTPTNTTFSSITVPTGWTCTNPAVGGTGEVLCTTTANVGYPSATLTFTYVVTVNAATAAGTTITNSADVTAETTDSVASNNATTTSVLVENAGQSDLAVSMTAAPTPVFVSSELTYTIQVQNLGLASASGVTLTDTLPAALTGASATTTQGTCGAPSGGTITCNLGTVAYPLGAPITITVKGTTPGTATTLANSVSVGPAAGDPVTSNNTATVLTVVQPLVCATPGKDGTPGSPLSGMVNTYYAGSGAASAGSTSITVATPSSGSSTQIGVGDLLLVIQMQGATINSTNTSSYGDGAPGDPASGSTGLGSSGEYEFVTVSNVTVNGGTDTLTIVGSGATGGLLNSYATVAASATQGAQTFQVIRVPQYASAATSSSLAALPWNGSVGGVLVLDVASQLTLGGTVSLDGDGFRGGGGRILTGQGGMLATDDVTLSTQAANGSKGEGIAGTPHYVAPALSTITLTTMATNTGQAYTEGLPNGSYARGAPGNAGGGATDADPTANDQNDGGGGGGNGGTGGQGGFAWESADTVGGFGGVYFPANTGAVVLGGGGGAGTSNNGAWWNPATNTGSDDCGADCTGIYSSGTAGGGIVIFRAGSVTGTGTITSNGQNALDIENDGGGGGGAGGSILVYANSGSLTGLTAIADGGNGGNTWPDKAPETFPGNRHGPGGGGGGGMIFTSSAPGSADVSGGAPGVSTLADDAYGATNGQPGVVAPGETITETPGTQSGAYCAGADLAVTNSATPNPVMAGGAITYTQTVTNSGPQDALNATVSEPVPANSIYDSIAVSGPDASGWTCPTPVSGVINCTNPDVPSGSGGAATFTVIVTVNPATVSGTQIADTISVASGTNDPNLANNSATAVVIVAAANSADLRITNTASPNPVLAGANITYTVVVSNAGPASASSVVFNSAIPANTAFVSAAQTSGTGGWTCSPSSISCNIGTFAPGATSTFTVVVKVNNTTPSGTLISDIANVSSSTTDPNPASNTATATVVVATAGQADLAVTKIGTPNPVLAGNTITYTITVTNNGPATATGVSLADTLPANTTFTSIVASPAGGWTCGTPLGGIERCTNASLVAGTTTFTLLMKVNAGTAPGTVITNTANVSATTTDPYSANNSASTTSVVTSPTQADVAIVKTASPEPVEQGTNLTYTLQVTNNGPAVAQNVVVTDPLPTEVTFVSVSIPAAQGTCSQSAGTVSCNIPSLSVGGVVIITINTTASTFSSTTLATNTATVSATTGDPNLTNNTSTAVSTIESPTAVELDSFTAQLRPGGGVVLQWRTREETRNLGFHVYREDATGRHRLDPSLIAGSALFFRGGFPQHRARTYEWIDPQGGSGASYWLEDVDLNGTSTLHGPVYAESFSDSSAPVAQARLMTQLNQAIAATPARVMPRLATPMPQIPALAPGLHPFSLDSRPAVEISISTEGWYRVTGAQLTAAGLPANLNVQSLQLYAEGVQQPILISGAGHGILGPNDAVEFYGTGIDTPFSGTRVYWLVSDFGRRNTIASIPAAGRGASTAESFPFSVLFQQRTTYFAALLNGEDEDNFFGAIVSSTPVDQVLTVAHVDPNSTISTTLDVTLQGVTQGQEHRVSVAVNGFPLGEMDFTGQANTSTTFPVNAGVIQNGNDTVTLTALNGDNDVSLVQSVQLNYAHTYTADSDWLKATAEAGANLRIDGFTQPSVEVFDITDPTSIVQLKAPATSDGSSYGVTVAVDGPSGSQRTLLAFAGDQISAPDSLAFHAPSSIGRDRVGAQFVVITHPDFLSSVQPLVKLHEAAGESVSVVTTDQIYDAYNYGERSPYAIRDYLQFAATQWRVHPRAVLLVGDASFDPRNYLGFGDSDFVPTRMIETAAFKTASDDWFTDFNQTGFATIPMGRLPVRTPEEAALVVSKIVNYESGQSNGSWNNQAVVIADQNIDTDFTSEANAAAAVLPPSLQVTKILADGQDPSVVKQNILGALNSGALLVNYTGHGAEEQWSFSDLFDDSTAATLTNGDRLPMFLLMDCLNGFFHDVYATSLSTSLMLAPNGGAVAVWASSGFTDAPPQATMDQAFLSAWAANPQLPIGSAILAAKSGITDQDVRRTWILFGDPEMRLQLPASTGSWLPRPTHIIVRTRRPY